MTRSQRRRALAAHVEAGTYVPRPQRSGSAAIQGVRNEQLRDTRAAAGVAYGVGGELINVPAQKARKRLLWDASSAARSRMDAEKRAALEPWHSIPTL